MTMEDGAVIHSDSDEDIMLEFENTVAAEDHRSGAPSPAAVSLQDSTTTGALTGRLPLCMYLTCDDSAFTKFQILLRKQLEFFETTSCPTLLNPKKQGRNRAIVLGQVGIRCMHCRLSVMQEQASKGAVYYPSTLSGVYQASQNCATHHFLADNCPNIPVSTKHELMELSQSSEKKSSGGKEMWARKAWALGVREDTIDGTLRFQRLEDRIESLHEMYQEETIMSDD